MHVEVVDVGRQRQHLFLRRSVEPLCQEGGVKRLRALERSGRERLIPHDCGQFNVGADESGDLISQGGAQLLFNRFFQRLRVFRCCLKYDVPAGDEGLHAQKTQRRKKLAQCIHFDGMAANVDGA
jgi:hypothetical protein